MKYDSIINKISFLGVSNIIYLRWLKKIISHRFFSIFVILHQLGSENKITQARSCYKPKQMKFQFYSESLQTNLIYFPSSWSFSLTEFFINDSYLAKLSFQNNDVVSYNMDDVFAPNFGFFNNFLVIKLFNFWAHNCLK